jgi:arylformamidase
VDSGLGWPCTRQLATAKTSRAIETGSLVYPGDPTIEIRSLCSIGDDSPCSISELAGWTTHFLTHVDPPAHFVRGGATLDTVPLERFVGPAVVVSVDGDCVEASDLPDDVGAGMNVLFRTRNSARLDSREFDEHHVYVTEGLATAAVDRGVNLVGLDYIGADRFGDEGYPVHRKLLGSGVLILEGLDLSGVEPGRYTLFALPLKIKDGDGSPVRAVLGSEAFRLMNKIVLHEDARELGVVNPVACTVGPVRVQTEGYGLDAAIDRLMEKLSTDSGAILDRPEVAGFDELFARMGYPRQVPAGRHRLELFRRRGIRRQFS